MQAVILQPHTEPIYHETRSVLLEFSENEAGRFTPVRSFYEQADALTIIPDHQKFASAAPLSRPGARIDALEFSVNIHKREPFVGGSSPRPKTAAFKAGSWQ
jgi:hypothetical protein